MKNTKNQIKYFQIPKNILYSELSDKEKIVYFLGMYFFIKIKFEHRGTFENFLFNKVELGTKKTRPEYKEALENLYKKEYIIENKIQNPLTDNVLGDDYNGNTRDWTKLSSHTYKGYLNVSLDFLTDKTLRDGQKIFLLALKDQMLIKANDKDYEIHFSTIENKLGKEKIREVAQRLQKTGVIDYNIYSTPGKITKEIVNIKINNINLFPENNNITNIVEEEIMKPEEEIKQLKEELRKANEKIKQLEEALASKGNKSTFHKTKEIKEAHKKIYTLQEAQDFLDKTYFNTTDEQVSKVKNILHQFLVAKYNGLATDIADIRFKINNEEKEIFRDYYEDGYFKISDEYKEEIQDACSFVRNILFEEKKYENVFVEENIEEPQEEIYWGDFDEAFEKEMEESIEKIEKKSYNKYIEYDDFNNNDYYYEDEIEAPIYELSTNKEGYIASSKEETYVTSSNEEKQVIAILNKLKENPFYRCYSYEQLKYLFEDKVKDIKPELIKVYDSMFKKAIA